jgi:hypothetical protein
LEAIVDAGVHTIMFVSAKLPDKSTANVQAECIKRINDSASGRTNPLIIIAGNLPSSDAIRSANSLTEVKLPKSANGTIPRIWYSTVASMQLLNSRIVETELGKLIIAELRLFK